METRIGQDPIARKGMISPIRVVKVIAGILGKKESKSSINSFGSVLTTKSRIILYFPLFICSFNIN